MKDLTSPQDGFILLELTSCVHEVHDTTTNRDWKN